MQVKENQKQLLDDCRITAANDTPVDTFTAHSESGHGRIETRTARVFDCAFTTDPEWLPLIAQIVEITRVRECWCTRSKQWKVSTEIAFYVSTARRSAREYESLIRGHWGIENRNHRVRDGTFAEDDSRIRKNPAIMAILISFSLNILRANNVRNVQNQRYAYALDFNKLSELKWLL